jgi:hypothetical protein
MKTVDDEIRKMSVGFTTETMAIVLGEMTQRREGTLEERGKAMLEALAQQMHGAFLCGAWAAMRIAGLPPDAVVSPDSKASPILHARWDAFLAERETEAKR